MLRTIYIKRRKSFLLTILVCIVLLFITYLLVIKNSVANNKYFSTKSYNVVTFSNKSTLNSRAKLEMVRSPRILIFSSDNRPLDNSKSNKFVRMSSAINYQYASAHGYHYKYYLIRYKKKNQNISKDVESCYNSLLKQERAGPWSKLQVLWHVYNELSDKYDWFFYLDSDAIIINHSLNLYDYVKHIPYVISNDRGCHFLTHTNCDIAFMHNIPFLEKFPNSGVFLFRSADTAQYSLNTTFALLLQLWWHNNRTDKNFVHDYEQSSLWNILYQYDFNKNISSNDSNTPLYAISKEFKLSRHIAIIDDFSFDFQNASQFIEHIGSTRKTRFTDMIRALHRLSINTTMAKSLLNIVRKKHLIELDTTFDRIPPMNLTKYLFQTTSAR